MGDKANYEAWVVKTQVFVFWLAVGVRTASDYSGVSRCLVYSGKTINYFLRRKT